MRRSCKGTGPHLVGDLIPIDFRDRALAISQEVAKLCGDDPTLGTLVCSYVMGEILAASGQLKEVAHESNETAEAFRNTIRGKDPYAVAGAFALILCLLAEEVFDPEDYS